MEDVLCVRESSLVYDSSQWLVVGAAPVRRDRKFNSTIRRRSDIGRVVCAVQETEESMIMCDMLLNVSVIIQKYLAWLV